MSHYAIVALVWLASLVAVGAWQRHDGATVERSAWQERDNSALRTANSEIQRLHAAAREQEAEHAINMGIIATRYEVKINATTQQMERDRAAVRAGTLRLYDHPPGLRAPACSSTEAGATASQRDGAAGSELSGAAAEFLLEEASRADLIVEQLGECQAVIKADRGGGL